MGTRSNSRSNRRAGRKKINEKSNPDSADALLVDGCLCCSSRSNSIVAGLTDRTRGIYAMTNSELIRIRAVNTLSEVERVHGVAAVDGALLLGSGCKLIKFRR
jgi:hypothetical protein